MRTSVCAALAAVTLLLTSCGGAAAPKAANPQSQPAESKSGITAPDTSNVTIRGDEDDPVNQLVMQAIADLETYWDALYPELYGTEFTPVGGGYYAVYPSTGELPPCATSADDISGNAFYCSTEDVIAWDAEGLLPDLQSKFGDFVIPVVLAHEFGHAVQTRADVQGMTVTRELQADCFAGAWSKHVFDDDVFDVNAAELDSALAGILELRDSLGTAADDPNAHGSGFDRVGAFQDGFYNGASQCREYRDNDPMVLALPFNNAEDEARAGDMDYGYVVNTVPYDLEDYWTHVYPLVSGGQPWVPVRGLEPFDPADPPMCGNQSAEGYALFYCVPGDYVGWDNVDAMPEIARKGGDYAVATLLATQYGLAVLNRLGDTSDEKTSTLRGDCFAGAYTASVILQNRPETSTFGISPGDLDEGITALLVYRGDGDVERQGAGDARVRAFRTGVLEGAEPCVTLEP